MVYLIALFVVALLWAFIWGVFRIVDLMIIENRKRLRRNKEIDELLTETEKLNSMIKEVHDEVFGDRDDDLDKPIVRAGWGE